MLLLLAATCLTLDTASQADASIASESTSLPEAATEALPKPAHKVRPAPRPAAATRPDDGRAKVQLVITQAMRARLLELGYGEADLGTRPASLTAERARAVIEAGIRRPIRELPRHWTRAGRQQSRLSVSKLLPNGSVLMTLAAVAALACANEPACVRATSRAAARAERLIGGWLAGLL